MSDTLIKKLTELVELIKAAGAPATPTIPAPPKMPTTGGKDNGIKTPNLNPTLRLPGQGAGTKVQQLSTTASAKSLKDPMHQAKQIQNDDTAKTHAMQQASMQRKANSNLAFGKSEAEEKRFYLVKEGQTSGQPKTESEILSEYGSMAEAEKKGFSIVPVIKEHLKTGSNGQWTLTKSDALNIGKITLNHDPQNFGASISGNFNNIKHTSVPANVLSGFEPDDKMTQPDSKKKLEGMKNDINAGAKMPPILVRPHPSGKGYQVIDGHHRFHAQKQMGVENISAQIVPPEHIVETGNPLTKAESSKPDSYKAMSTEAKKIGVPYTKDHHKEFVNMKKLAEGFGHSYSADAHLDSLRVKRILGKDDIDEMIRTKMKQEMDKRGLTGKDIADHYRDTDETIPAKHRANIKNALKQQKIKETPNPKLQVVKNEELEKGLKSAITSGLVGASMLVGGSGKAQAASAPVKAPIAQVQQAPTRAPEMQADTSTGNQVSGKTEKGGSPTFNTKTYGPYQIKTMYEPRVGDGHKSYNLTHAVSWNGTPSPEHMAAVAKEYNIEPKNLQGLNANPGHEDGGGKVDIDGNWTRGKPSGDTWLQSKSTELKSPGKGEPSGSLYESKDQKSPINQIKLIKNLLGQWSLINSESEIKADLIKSNEIKPIINGERVNTYDSTANIGRKATRTGEVRPEMGGNQAVRSYTTTGSSMSAAHEIAEGKRQKKKSKASVRTLGDMSPEEQETLKAKYKQ